MSLMSVPLAAVYEVRECFWCNGFLAQMFKAVILCMSSCVHHVCGKQMHWRHRGAAGWAAAWGCKGLLATAGGCRMGAMHMSPPGLA